MISCWFGEGHKSLHNHSGGDGQSALLHWPIIINPHNRRVLNMTSQGRAVMSKTSISTTFTSSLGSEHGFFLCLQNSLVLA